MKKIDNIGWSDEPFFSEKQRESVVIILFLEKNGKDYIILQKRAKNIRQGGEISLPGGFFEISDNSKESCILRECKEELGIEESQVNITGKLGRFIAANNMIIDVFIGRVELNIEFNPSKDEVEKLIFLPLDLLMEREFEEYSINVKFSVYDEYDGEKITVFPAKELKLPEIYHNSWKGKNRKISLFKYEGEVIWGITASILEEFKRRVL